MLDVAKFGRCIPDPSPDLVHLTLEAGPLLTNGFQPSLAFLDLPLQLRVLGRTWDRREE